LLDIGCGWGDLSGQLGSLLADYIGVEPSMKELDRFHQSQGRYLIHGIGENLGFLRSGSRNVILLNSVLDHCLDWEKTLDNCLRILQPGGLLIISMENSEKLPTKVRQVLGQRVVHEGHLAFFSVQQMASYVKEKGLLIESVQTMGFLYGMHQLTRTLPLPVPFLKVLNSFADGLGSMAYPNGGHIMFICARKPIEVTDPQVLHNPFQCPKCNTPIVFGNTKCEHCLITLEYSESGILNAMILSDVTTFLKSLA